MTRNGKIARLPRPIRDELNHRLDNGEQGIQLVEWLNSLPEVKKILDRDFGGRPINQQNLSDWKAGGYEDWCAEKQSQRDEQTLEMAQNICAFGDAIAEATEDRLAQGLATVVAARYAALLQNWSGEVTDQFRAKLRALRMFSREIVRLQRSDQGAERTKIERQRLELQQMKTRGHLTSQSIQSILASPLFDGPAKNSPEVPGPPPENKNPAGPSAANTPNQAESS